MNPRRPYSNRPGGQRPGGSRGGFGGGNRRGGFGGGRPQRRGRGGPELPMLLGEPSPSLAKINTMNMAKLTAKIASLKEEALRMAAKLERLEAQDPPNPEKIKQAQMTITRLQALEKAAAERLAGKIERKAMRESRG